MNSFLRLPSLIADRLTTICKYKICSHSPQSVAAGNLVERLCPTKTIVKSFTVHLFVCIVNFWYSENNAYAGVQPRLFKCVHFYFVSRMKGNCNGLIMRFPQSNMLAASTVQQAHCDTRKILKNCHIYIHKILPPPPFSFFSDEHVRDVFRCRFFKCSQKMFEECETAGSAADSARF